MAEIIKIYRQSAGSLRFIGKKYGDEHRVNGTFGSKWDEWHESGWFGEIEKLLSPKFLKSFDGADAYVGLMSWKYGEPFEYWIGMFAPQDAPVPSGFKSVDFNNCEWGVCWVQGVFGDIFFNEEKCAQQLQDEGMVTVADESGAYWFFERYACPRFTAPDESGNVILDICHFIK